jgi:FtsP/CotA-like multicopper oxidase with cupredoxin domain
MALPLLAALTMLSAPLIQESVVPAPPRGSLPRPMANTPIMQVNQNRQPVGTRNGATLTLSLDIVEAGFQAEGDHDPVVRALAFAEPGKAPVVPGPLIRAPIGTTVQLTLRNRSDSGLVFGGFRRGISADRDTFQLAAGATRTVTFRLDRVGNYFYWGALAGLKSYDERFWLDSQLTGALIVDPVGAPAPSPNERIWVVTEWFHE